MMHHANLSEHEVSWWLMRQLLTICFWVVVLSPFAVAAWIVVVNAADVEDINRQKRVAEAPRIAATMGAISRLKPRPRECDIDANAMASCEVFTRQGERRVLQVSGGQ